MPGEGKTLPYFARLGIHVHMIREDGVMMQLIFTPDRSDTRSPRELLDEFIEHAVERGVFPPTRDQFAAYAMSMIEQAQREFMTGPLQDKATSAEELRKFLATYEGPKGGDA